MLQAPSFDCVYRWRLEQEQKLAGGIGRGNRIMNAAEVSRFIQFYQRLTELCLTELPARVHHLYPLDVERQVQGYLQPV
jgi:D-glycerate 3-kinase